MTRISVKPLMYVALMTAAMFSGTATRVYGQLQPGTPIGPGVGGQVHAFAFDRDNQDVAYAGGDVCGVYKYKRSENKWYPWSLGLGLNDLNEAYYVDDLVVVREPRGSGGPDLIPQVWEGVYAATRGGIYFRQDDSHPWICLTSDNVYSTGHARQAFHWDDASAPTIQKIPFSCIAFDSTSRVLYAGAGSARMSDGTIKNYYPCSVSPTGAGEYSLWMIDLKLIDNTTGNPPVSPDLLSTDKGYVRQIAVAHYGAGGNTTKIIYACDNGIANYDPQSYATEMIWTPNSPNKVGFVPLSDSSDPWGVAMGQDGVLYAAMSRMAVPPLSPGIWMCDLNGSETWNKVEGNGQLRLCNGTYTDWSDYLLDAAHHKRDLSELSVFTAPSGEDEIYVGIGRIGGQEFGDCGYLRYGTYALDNSSTPAAMTGWAYIHQTMPPSGTGPSEVHVVDWKHNMIHEHILSEEALGWQSYYPSLRALVPFAIHPNNSDIMVAIDYQMPMGTWLGGTDWSNLYCKAPMGGGWQNAGLNMLCAESDGFMSGGRLLIGSADTGVFCATSSANDYFIPLHAPTTVGSPLDFQNAIDLEVVTENNIEEIYMVNELEDDDGNSATDENAGVYVWPAGAVDWINISQGTPSRPGIQTTIGAAGLRLAITDVVMVTPDRMFVAAAAGSNLAGYETFHYFICEGVRTAGTHDWTWAKRWNCGSDVVTQETMQINTMCLLQGTSTLLVGGKTKSSGPGGVYAFDYQNLSGSGFFPPEVWLNGNSLQSDFTPLGANVTALAVAPIAGGGSVLYVGSSRHDSAWFRSCGGLTRINIDDQGSRTREILSGPDSWHFPLELADHPFYPANVNVSGNGPIDCWAWCAKVTDIAISPTDPMTCYAAVNNGSYHDDQTGVWRYSVKSWDHIWGGGESGSGAKTVEINSTGDKLYIGSVGQEFFAVNVTAPPAPPIIETEAAYPMSVGVNQAAPVFAVEVHSPLGTSISKVELFSESIGGAAGALLLNDLGQDLDAVAGDGIYTSPRFAISNLSAGHRAARVSACTADGRNVTTTVGVTVMADLAPPEIHTQAIYPILAENPQPTTVLAVRVTPAEPVPGLIAPVKKAVAIVGGIGGTGFVEMGDDGVGEDVKAGDGIYTSTPFQSQVAPRQTPQVIVSAEPLFGQSTFAYVSVGVVASKAKFDDVTASTGDLVGALSELPYSAVYFPSKPRDATSSDVMVVTYDSDGSGKAPQILQAGDPASNGAPVFFNKTNDWMTNDLQPGSRGICYADYDNDGDMDFFICNPVSGGKLYRNRLNEGLGFRNATTAVFGADSTYVAHAITAAWGDYNADGFADLYVAGTSYFNSVQALTGAMVAAVDGGGGGNSASDQEWVFRNRQGKALSRTNCGGPIVSNVVLSACWADMDNDGDLDLITSKYILGAVRVWENVGYVPAVGDNVLGETGWIMPTTDPDRVFGTNSVTVFDENHDSYPDLVVTFATDDGDPKVKILRNRFDTGGADRRVFETYTLAHGVVWNGATVADFDLDGQSDIVLQPRVAGLAPALYLGRQPVAQLWPTYVDAGYALGLRGGVTGGAIAADFDDEHNIDLYLGRSGGASARAVYRNVGTAASTQRWLEVKLTTQAQGQGSLLGTKVVVECDGRTWTRTVEGGSGRGGQGASRLLFGLGVGQSSTATVTAYFPSGEVEPSNSVSANGSLVELDEHLPIAFTVGSDPTCSYELAPGQTDWIFKWKTSPYRGDPMLDKVEVKNDHPYQPDGDCGIGILTGRSKPLTWGMPGVEYRVYKVGSEWIHEVRWTALPCGANCQYKFRVTSGLGAQSVTSDWYPTTTNSFCVPDPDPILNQQ